MGNKKVGTALHLLAAALIAALAGCGGGNADDCAADAAPWPPTIGAGQITLPDVGDDGGDAATCDAIARR